MDDYSAWIHDCDSKLMDAEHVIAVIRKSLAADNAPWDAANFGLRLAKQKLAIAGVDLAAARTRYAQSVIDKAVDLNDSFEAGDPPEDPDEPV